MVCEYKNKMVQKQIKNTHTPPHRVHPLQCYFQLRSNRGHVCLLVPFVTRNVNSYFDFNQQITSRGAGRGAGMFARDIGTPWAAPPPAAASVRRRPFVSDHRHLKTIKTPHMHIAINLAHRTAQTSRIKYRIIFVLYLPGCFL